MQITENTKKIYILPEHWAARLSALKAEKEIAQMAYQRAEQERIEIERNLALDRSVDLAQFEARIIRLPSGNLALEAVEKPNDAGPADQ